MVDRNRKNIGSHIFHNNVSHRLHHRNENINFHHRISHHTPVVTYRILHMKSIKTYHHLFLLRLTH